MNPIPASLTQRPTCSGLMSIFTPSEDDTSAAPERDESARLPCLATGTPAPATIKAAQVETFTEPEPSPPVPTISTASGGAVTRSIFERIAETAPVISSTVSPRTRSAINRPPICEGVASPDIMLSKAQTASSRDSVAPVATLPMIDLRSSIACFQHLLSVRARGLGEGDLIDRCPDILLQPGNILRELLVTHAALQGVLQVLHLAGREVNGGRRDVGDAEDEPFGPAGARRLSGEILCRAESRRDETLRHAWHRAFSSETAGGFDLQAHA